MKIQLSRFLKIDGLWGRKANRVLFFALAVVLLVIFLRMVIFHFRFIQYPYPGEYREAAIIFATDILVKGGNPFALENQPQYTNVYGLFYNVAVLPFAKLFGATLRVHRAFSAFCMLMACYILFLMLRNKKVPIVLGLAASLLFYINLLDSYTIMSRPDSLGLVLFLLGLYLPWRFNFSKASLIGSLILGTLGFYTKLYFVLLIPCIILYEFIFLSRRNALRQALAACAFIAMTMIIVESLNEVFFSNVIFINLSDCPPKPGWSHRQFGEFIRTYRGLLAAVFIIAIPDMIRLFRSARKKAGCFSDDLKFKRFFPLPKMDFMLFCFIFFIVVLEQRLGKVSGAWMLYLYHLLTPFFLVVLFGYISKKKWIALSVPFVLITILVNAHCVLDKEPANNKAWDNWRTLISQHQKIFSSPPLATLIHEQGKKFYDSGHSEYFVQSLNRQFPLSRIYPTKLRLRQRWELYKDDIANLVRAKYFNRVILTKDYSPFIRTDFLEKYYIRTGTFPAPMPYSSLRGPMTWAKQEWELEVWEPK